MTTYTCKRCNGTKHVLGKNGWERCSCLTKDMLNRLMAYGGISLPQEDLTLDNLITRFPHVQLNNKSIDIVKGLNSLFSKGGIPKKLFCIQGSQNSCLDVVVQSVLKTAIEHGKGVRQVSLQNIITSHFNEKEFDLHDLFNCDILSIYFGQEIQYNISINILLELIRHAWLKDTYLLFSTSLNFDMLGQKYGSEIQRSFVRNGIDTIYENERRIIFIPLEQ